MSEEGGTGASTQQEPSTQGTLKRAGEPDLVWRLHPPSDGRPRALLFFVHGLAEHFGRYTFPVAHFTQRGFLCAGLDLRGHGLSAGHRAHVDRFEQYVDDVEAVRAHVVGLYPDLPALLIGHSMGGVVAIRHAVRRPEVWRGLILSSPGLAAHPDSAPPRWLAAIAQVISWSAPKLHFSTDLDPSFVCRDPDVVQAYKDDPLVTTKVSARWFTEFIKAQDLCFEDAAAGRPDLQVLAMQSGADRLVDPAATRRYAERLGEKCRFQTWPDFFHEMLNESERDMVFARMQEWIEPLLG